MPESILPVSRPCVRCGCTERYKKGDCKQCAKVQRAIYKTNNLLKIKASDLAYQKANKEKIQAGRLAWVEANPEKNKASRKAWVTNNQKKMQACRDAWIKANPVKAKSLSSDWRKNNPDAVTRYNHNRRARKLAAGGKLSAGVNKKLFDLQKGLCPCCSQPLLNNYHLDHIVPLYLGGTNTDDNVQLMRAGCNLHKGSKHPIDFMQSKGFLL